MCGVLGILDRSDVSRYLLRGIGELRHRGPNAWGLATVGPDGRPWALRVGDNPSAAQTSAVHEGRFGVAHARYATTDDKTDLVRDAQPLVKTRTGLALVFNGHVQTAGLRDELEGRGASFQTNNDGELLLNLLDSEIQSRQMRARAGDPANFFRHVLGPSVMNLMMRLRGRGAYAVVGAFGHHGLFAFRDPNGFRPLIYAADVRGGPAHVFSSETTVLKALGAYATVRQLDAGELIYITPDEQVYSVVLMRGLPAFCALEGVYFAAADSVLGGAEVDELRRRLGGELAATFAHLVASVDVVVPVPDSASPAAFELAFQWNKPVGGMAKAADVRSFLEPNQTRRERAADSKYRYFRSFIRGRRVALVDDSLVRGTTMLKVVERLWQLGAREVHVLVTFPPVTHPCYYGIDLPSAEHLLAAQHSGDVESIRRALSADSLNYLSEEAVRRVLAPLGSVCMACTNGKYVDGNPVKEARRACGWRPELRKEPAPTLRLRISRTGSAFSP